MFKNSKVLVTGGAGFIGVNLIKRLLSEGVNVRATLFNRGPVISDDRIEYIRGDLRLEEFCKQAVDGVDYVFMCAANTSGAEVIANTPMVHLTPNVLMNMQMLHASYSRKIKKFLFISSNVVYPLVEFPVRENDVSNDFYESYYIVAWMKRFTELVCDMYSNQIKPSMQTVIIRPGNLYGPYDKFDWEKSKVIPAIVRRAIERKNPFMVWGDGKDLKDFLYIDDFIDGLMLAMEKVNEFESINLASGIPVTIRDVLAEVLKSSDYEDADVQYDATKPTMIPKRMIDISLAKKRLGFEPKVSLDDGIQKTIDWYREFYKETSPEEVDNDNF
jgi:GDP-L-fucose synthase